MGLETKIANTCQYNYLCRLNYSLLRHFCIIFDQTKYLTSMQFNKITYITIFDDLRANCMISKKEKVQL